MKPIPISTRYPDEHDRVLIFDAKHREWHVGWNAYQHRLNGPSTPGTWVLPFGDTDEMHITHWLPCPAEP